MKFEIVGDVQNIETIATGRSTRILPLLNKRYGKGRRRKKKGVATVKLHDGTHRVAEVTGMKRTGSGGVTERSNSPFSIEI